MASAAERGGHVQLQLGAYVLGGLTEAEEASVIAHLDRCVLCRAEYEELSCVPPWLDLLGALSDADDFGDGFGAPASGGPGDGDASERGVHDQPVQDVSAVPGRAARDGGPRERAVQEGANKRDGAAREGGAGERAAFDADEDGHAPGRRRGQDAPGPAPVAPVRPAPAPGAGTRPLNPAPRSTP
jgi:hypothetical protein